MASTGAKILMVIAPEQFRDEELNHPREVFNGAGAQVTVASTRTGVANGKLGYKENVSKTLDDVAGENFDAVVVVGGGGSHQYLYNNKRLHDILRRHHGAGKVVAAICVSGGVLANAGLLTGVDATVWKSDETMKAYTDNKVHFVDKPVVRAGKIVTANGPSAARDFGRTILEALSGK
ncbi:MAG: DJ-1/PfpI family protein [Nitrospinae bacterium]|nr:DJ-1/PfpI family protein [Nitrospinota bacterium]